MSRPKIVVVTSVAYQKLAEKYREYLLKLGHQPKSCRAHYNHLCEFLSWLEGKGIWNITEVTQGQITTYYTYLSTRPSRNTGQPLSTKTTHGHIRNLKDFFAMLQQQSQITKNPCSNLNFPYPRNRKERTVLTRDEIKLLYTSCETIQQRTLLSLGYGCGLRVGELVKCNVEDVQLEIRQLIIPEGKGNKRRVVPLSLGVVNDLSKYLKRVRRYLKKTKDYTATERAFMLHSKGGRIREYTANKYLKKIINNTQNQTTYAELSRSIKDKSPTFHTLRHSIATHLLQQGISTEQVRLFLGHSQLETTQLYTHINQNQLKELIE